MTVGTYACAASAGQGGGAREPLEARLARYEGQFQRSLHDMAQRSRALGDLLYTFPGAAMTMAGGGLSPADRLRAGRLLEEGRPLAEAAGALGLPMWLKRLPPEAFSGPPGPLPGGEDFSRRIVNHLPQSPKGSAAWLRRVAFGAEACNPDFALWLAQQSFSGKGSGQGAGQDARKGPEGGPQLAPLAAYAWFSGKDNAHARRLINRRWNGKMSFAMAVRELRVWLERLVLGYCAGGDSGGVHINAYYFTPLYTSEELSAEAAVMKNCLAQYASRVAAGQCQIYSIRRGGYSVANMELRLHAGRELRIAQLRGPGNVAPSSEVQSAAEVWLGQWKGLAPPLLLPGEANPWGRMKIAASRWKRIWGPYLEARPRYVERLRKPGEQTLIWLCEDVRALERWSIKGA
jgi:hypothetical protein